MEKIEFLKQRSKEFWETAVDLFQKRRYNLCVFNLEQACQLWLKYLIAKKLGNWPQIHYLAELIKEFSKAYSTPEILDYYKENELFFDDLSDAYFVSRYYPKDYTETLAKKLITECEKFIKLTENVTGERFFVNEKNEDIG